MAVGAVMGGGTMQVRWLVALAALGCALLTGPRAADAAEVHVLCTGAARAAFEEIAPQFERASGHKIVVQYGLPPALVAKLDAGEPVDVLLLSYDVAGLIKQGKLAADSRTVLGRSGVGVAIPQGAPKPDLSSVESFKRALLGAKAIATSGEGSSGRYVLTLLDRLGIAAEVKPKIKSGGAGSAAQLVARREVDFAVIGLPPVLGVPGVEWVGDIPAELQSYVLFTAALGSKAKEPAAGRALLAFLKSPPAAAVFKAKGLDPVP
jgi:molybdate transport system substrate-binding protein